MNIIEIAHHRNGIAGEGFYAVLFRDKAAGRYDDFLAIVFETPGHCAVLNVAETVKRNIGFAAGNSWRGDCFEEELRTAIAAFEEAQRAAGVRAVIFGADRSEKGGESMRPGG